MKLKIIIILFFMLMLPIISISDICISGESPSKSIETIKVSILKGGDFAHLQYTSQFNTLNNYRWIVNNQIYEFQPTIYVNERENLDENRTIFLSNDNTDVLVNDGGSFDGTLSGMKDIFSEPIRNSYRTYLDNGGGYIGVCGGGHFPLPLIKKPNTAIELFSVHRNSFIENMETKTDVNYGNPIFSQFLGVTETKNDYRRCFRRKFDPNAQGVGAYCNMHLTEPETNISKVVGIPVNLTSLDKTHPIFKDYWGDTLFTMAYGGSSYVIGDDYVDSLASYPVDYAEHNESTQIYAWKSIPRFTTLKAFIALLKFICENGIDYFAVEDLPESYHNLYDDGDLNSDSPKLIKKIISTYVRWKKTDMIVKTRNVFPYLDSEGNGQPKPAIIAFEYDDNPNKGRVLMSGPHPFTQTFDVWHGGEIVNHNQQKNHNALDGFYHWVNKTNDWISTDEEPPNTYSCFEHDYTNNSWYYRRKVAWAAKVPDEHLPPVYGRSQVLDITPYMQDSQVFDIKCSVGYQVTPEGNKKWDYEKLKLYYKYYNAQGVWSSEWQEYNTDDIVGLPYKFTFDASNAEGDGLYRFCSIFITSMDSEFTSYDIEEFPPMYDTEVMVNGDIFSYIELENKYPYAKDSIPFNSTGSITKPGTQITSYYWDFGDGHNSTLANPTHTYDDNGEYNVNLTVTNNISSSDSTVKTITVHNNPPTINFNPEYKVVFVNETVNFTDKSSDIDGSVTNWSWDFGDNYNSTNKNTSHIYTKSGYYTVSLEITDDDNYTSEKNGGILVIDTLVNQSRSQQTNIFNKIQDAIDNSTANEYIYVENGTYSENLIINNSVSVIGEDKVNVVLPGSIVMNNPYDYELPSENAVTNLIIVNMSACNLLMHFNNDTDVGEDYSTSNVIFDYSGEGNNGTNNGATWTTSTIKGEGAFDFDGFDDSINLTSISALTEDNVTVSAWINLDNGNGIEYPIISQMNTTSGYCLFVNNSTMKPCFKLDNDVAISSKAIGTNEWHNIVGVHNETDLKIYVDGKLTGTTSKTGNGLDSLGFIGYDNNSNYFDGRIDELAVWNQTLIDDEIKLLYEGNFGVKIESFTIRDSNIGVTPVNHSSLDNCLLINHTVGVLLNNTMDICIQMCNMSDVKTGVKIEDSSPEIYYYNRLVDCYIDDVESAVTINSTSNLYIFRSMVNGSVSNLSFYDCDMDDISVIHSWSPNNVAPDVPSLSGPTLGDINTTYIYSSSTNDSNDDFFYYFFDWGDGNNSGWINKNTQGISNFATHKWMEQGGYYVKVKASDIFDVESNWSTSILFKTETLPPLINSVSDNPDTVGFGYDVTITTNVTDDTSGNYSGIKTIKVNITYPDDSYVNASMTDIGNDTYQYVFSDTWLVGKYNYSIWAIDNAYNTNTSTGHWFNVSVDATISVCTINNTYSDNCTVNLTDPPSSSYLVGYELIDDGEVLHIWNNLDSYYFNTSSGIQLTNHYDEYWSHNVLMLGYYNNDEWNLIYRTDELSGFNKDIVSDNETYVNATLWKNLNYNGYDFRLAIRYHLGIDDNELTIIPYIKNIDNENIPYNLGFAWEIKDIQIDMTEENDYININGTSYFLNTSGLNETYTNMDIPSFIIKENITDTKVESLYLRWDENLNYKVQVKSRSGQYNAPVTLGIKIGPLNIGQEKSTELFWYDACKTTYPYNSYDTMVAWATNPSNMVDGSTGNYASTTIDRDLESCNDNTCIGVNYGTISKVEIRAYGKYSGSDIPPIHDIRLKALGGTHIYSPSTTGAWSNWYDITNNPGAPSPWLWTDVENLIVDVEASIMGMYTVYCSKVEVQVTYNANPIYSNNYPVSGSNGIDITPTLNLTVNDEDGDTMNLTWWSNSSGSWQIFGTNNSVSNGTYHQTFTNATVNGQWWYWKVNISDGHNYKETNVFSFYTGYQSKIENTGSTNFSGYLLMQIEYYNTTNSTWVLEQEVVNETTTRTINAGGTLALDTIFNSYNVSTSSFTNGDGTYRVYTAFRDPDGDALVCDDESLLEDSYQFTVS